MKQKFWDRGNRRTASHGAETDDPVADTLMRSGNIDSCLHREDTQTWSSSDSGWWQQTERV